MIFTIDIFHVDSETHFVLFIELILQFRESNLCLAKQHHGTKKVCSQVHVFIYINQSVNHFYSTFTVKRRYNAGYVFQTFHGIRYSLLDLHRPIRTSVHTQKKDI